MMNDTQAIELQEFRERVVALRAELASIGQVTVEASERRLIAELHGARLYRYGPARNPRALFIIYALINRPYLLDLEPDRSLLRRLGEHGLSCYVLEWAPARDSAALGLCAHVEQLLTPCLQRVREDSANPQVDVLGVCQGGVLALGLVSHCPTLVRRLITMVTPVDFHAPDFHLARLARHLDTSHILDERACVPGARLTAGFLALQPMRLTMGKYLALLAADRSGLESFLRLENWVFDNPDHPGALFLDFVSWFIQRNAWMYGGVDFTTKRWALHRIQVPVLNVYALADHIVPPASSRPLRQLLGGHCDDFAFPAGHIGIYVSRRAQQAVPAKLVNWLYD